MENTKALESYVRPSRIERKFVTLRGSDYLPMLGLPKESILDNIALTANLEDKESCSGFLYKYVSYVHKHGAVVEFHQMGRFPISNLNIQISGRSTQEIQTAGNDLKNAFKFHTKYILLSRSD